MKFRHLAIAAVVLAGGGVPVVALTTSPAASASTTSAQHQAIRHLPRWFHWKYASMAATRQECSTHNHPAIIVWITGGTSSSLVCPDGTSFSS